MKYIIVRDRDDEEYAILFPDKIIHKDVARIHRASDVRLVSAGFCSVFPEAKAWGKSESLGGKFLPRPEDAEIIGLQFNEMRGYD